MKCSSLNYGFNFEAPKYTIEQPLLTKTKIAFSTINLHFKFYLSSKYKLYFTLFIKNIFMLNPTEQAIRHLLARIVIGHF